jgi:RimJ/RimL family protein N-acetyltransferase
MDLPIRTERLVLRAHTLEDLDPHHALFGDPEVVAFLYDEPMERDAAAEHLAKRLGSELPEEGGWLNLAVEYDGRVIGDVGLSLVSRTHRQCEIGYVFLPEVSGRGFATEAADAMMRVAFEELDAHRVTGRLDARNAASARLLERLGMRREAHLRENEWVKGEWTDELVYAITENEWRARDAPA